jgi:hypothetical protein
MDSLHAIGFYVSATLSIGGALLVALLPRRDLRGLAMGLLGIGIGGLDLSLSAGFAGGVVLVCYLAMAALVGGPGYRAFEPALGMLWRQLGAVAAAGLFGLLAFAALRGDFVHATFYGGALGTAAVGRFLFAHDALATEAVGALILAALVGAGAAWRARERAR